MWSFDNKLVKQADVDGDYPLCIKLIDSYIVVGNGRGDIIFFDHELRSQKVLKVAKDAISDILITEEYLIVASHDGSITVLLRNDLSIHKQIDIQYPILQICSYQNSYYVAGSFSWKISADFAQI